MRLIGRFRGTRWASQYYRWCRCHREGSLAIIAWATPVGDRERHGGRAATGRRCPSVIVGQDGVAASGKARRGQPVCEGRIDSSLRLTGGRSRVQWYGKAGTLRHRPGECSRASAARTAGTRGYVGEYL